MERDEVYLKHILDAIVIIEDYVRDVNFGEFLNNKLLQDGVVRELEIVGEAAKNLSQDFKERYNDIPWRKIMGMRNRLIHEYFGVSLKAVWQTVSKDLPQLKKWIEGIMV